ncbi:MAG TPA: tetratricopeptide repeat protein [Thermoanaerobaculia bacterium]|jgi:Tfp pilus assembly protein PilF|nr:tetratricopeptide repeat protein [Thermoanaerobaculia bacterium]
MRRAFTSSLTVVALLLIAIGCGTSGDTTKAETQSQFGVRMARMNLWREAMFRFRRAVEINPSDAQAHNNLAVALEAIGDFDGAAKEYREALRLDRSNQHIQKNYSRFVEFTQKAKKREAGAVTTTATDKTDTTGTTGTTGTTT